MFRLIILVSLLFPPLPPVAEEPYSHSAEVWLDQFCDAAGGDIGWRPEIYPYIDPSTQQCMLKCVNQYCDLPWDHPRGNECDQFWIELPDTWDWSPWCSTRVGRTVQKNTIVIAQEKVHGIPHSREHMGGI